MRARAEGGDEVAFDRIPVIDLAPMQRRDAAARSAVARELRAACTEVGFFYITGHGVPTAVIAGAFAQCPRFFGLPDAEKRALHLSRAENHSGYTPLLAENTDPTARGDLHEAFDWANELPPDHPARRAAPEHYGANLWPAGLAGFREALTAYGTAMRALADRLFAAFALALDLSADFFVPYTTHPTMIIRLLHYPSQTGTIDPQQIGIGAHSDYECFTILAQDTVPALQVRNQQGVWIDAPPIPGTFVVNIGDQMARWSNDVFASTLHRAVNRSGVARHSIPCFVGTNHDTLITALPSCVGPDRPAKYPPVYAGAHVSARLQASYGRRDAAVP